MIEKSVLSLIERNESHIAEVFSAEEKVNAAQIEIDNLSLRLIALYQPAASDLRFLISTIKINSDLERMADLAVNTAQMSQQLLKEPPLKPLIDIPRMAEITQKMVQDSLNAFLKKDSGLAREVCLRDDSVDDLNNQIFRELLTYMLEDTKNINRAIKLVLVSRHLERIADHATNIAEDVYYIVEGKDIRHHANDNV